MYISTPPSPEVENFQMTIYYPAGGIIHIEVGINNNPKKVLVQFSDQPGPAEPEVDMLLSEPARRACR